MTKQIRIGSGSAWWGDRIEPAILNARSGQLDYLCFETMAEATISAAQVRARKDPKFPGYDTYLEDRMRAVLPLCHEQGIKIISNQGWINPKGAAQFVTELLDEMGIHGVKVAAVEGSLITDRIHSLAQTIMDTNQPIESIRDEIISAEAYMGAEPIVEALRSGAQIVITGRVADPSLFLAPMMYEFGWQPDDYERLGAGSGIGHLLECGSQVTGGYYADPGFKDVPEPWNFAFPIAIVQSDGSAIITKAEPSGGEVSLGTVKEQLLYEVHNPARYITPDVVVDFSQTILEQVRENQVLVKNITGHPRTDTLKVSIGCTEGYVGEDMFFYAGPGALRRAQLAKEILEKRFEIVNLQAEDIAIDFLGLNAIHGLATPADAPEPYEIAVRVAARTKSYEEAFKIGREVDGMAVSGVGCTGKKVPHQERVREVIGVVSTLVSREAIQPEITIYES